LDCADRNDLLFSFRVLSKKISDFRTLKMNRANEMYEKAYDDLTKAVARAKRVCRGKHEFPYFHDATTTIAPTPSTKPTRGRPKGSKTSKSRMKQNKAQPRNSECVTSKIEGSDVSLSFDSLTGTPKWEFPASCGNDFEVDGSLNASEISFALNHIDSQDASDQTFEKAFMSCISGSLEENAILVDYRHISSIQTMEHTVPECWNLPLP
jgi:hypothetical protein